jgi:DNA-binding transcriptional ArsR family regulator
VIADVDVSPVAALLGDAARARIVQALLSGRTLPAGVLARHAAVSASTASAHLAKLVDGGLLTVTRSGRHRYFQIASAEVSRAVEALAAIAPPSVPHSLRHAAVGEVLAAARTCYDHLAGSLGVMLTDALLERGALSQTDEGFALGPHAKVTLAMLEIDTDALPQRRPAALRCLDWSERRPHVAGAVGAAICTRALEARWVTRLPNSRAVRLTAEGRRAFAELGDTSVSRSNPLAPQFIP